jgi:hypothetical protein
MNRQNLVQALQSDFQDLDLQGPFFIYNGRQKQLTKIRVDPLLYGERYSFYSRLLINNEHIVTCHLRLDDSFTNFLLIGYGDLAKRRNTKILLVTNDFDYTESLNLRWIKSTEDLGRILNREI